MANYGHLRCRDLPTAVGVFSPPRKGGPRQVGAPVVGGATLGPPASCRPRTTTDYVARDELLVAGPAARVGEGAIAAGRLREELPVEARGMQRQLEDAVGGVVAHHAVVCCRAEAVVVHAARAHDDLSDTVRRVGVARRILRREALVDVIVPVEH